MASQNRENSDPDTPPAAVLGHGQEGNDLKKRIASLHDDLPYPGISGANSRATERPGFTEGKAKSTGQERTERDIGKDSASSYRTLSQDVGSPMSQAQRGGPRNTLNKLKEPIRTVSSHTLE
jgi:hypothetical protein